MQILIIKRIIYVACWNVFIKFTIFMIYIYIYDKYKIKAYKEIIYVFF